MDFCTDPSKISFPEALLMAISQTDAALKKTSFCGEAIAE
jgi:hypothetical protein